METEYKQLLKIIILGDSGVGKTNLLIRYIDKKSSESHVATIGVDFKFHVLTLPNGSKVKIHIWDTAGQESFAKNVSAFYRNTAGVILVFDITNRDSYESIQKRWMEELNYKLPNVKITLVGNKLDLENKRTVTYDEAKQFADKWDMEYCEISTRDPIQDPVQDHVLNDMFMSLVTRIIDSNKLDSDELDSNLLDSITKRVKVSGGSKISSKTKNERKCNV